MKKKKLIKFDIVHPSEYLEQKKKKWKDLDSISAEEYRNRLIKLRSNYSDFYTYHLNKMEDWEAEEFFLLDDTYLFKIAEELFGKSHALRRFRYGYNKRLKLNPRKWRNYVVDKYIQKFKPDVIFARSQPIPSAFWQRYRKHTLLVARLSARLPHAWHPNDWDLIYTDQPDFRTFFELHGVKTILNDQGFDSRVAGELKAGDNNSDIVFIGGLGTENFLNRTLFLNEVAKELENFKWWGYWWKYGGDGRALKDFPALQKTFHGFTSGLEMFQIYRNSAIVVNDYVDTANGIGFNQRIFEVMGSGGFMLTRDAPNLKDHFPMDLFVTYKNKEDFKEKVSYYLQNSVEREKIAKNAQDFIFENFDYTRIVREFSSDLITELQKKFG
ncbi:glycosyltransferase family protein [Autumnicola edwardsiae]|uniref:Glycosyltransferase n=1 Tax=Autumnicola edwardsiae TaxID=3075594 RepID=A0ABU3CT54_9FLAO|nr:glycosyltransferase [Zunongwangia sp. F297]MDT0649090.1 glycosyltransferase [Zunongwangia sp. F297]